MKTWNILPALPLVALMACGSTNTPEGAGAALAEKKCACYQIKREARLARSAATLDAMKQNPALRLEETYSMPSPSDDAWDLREEQCDKEGEKLMEEVQLKYPREEDRKTIKNAASDRYEICERELKNRLKDQERALEKEIQKLEAARSGDSR